MFFIPRGNSSAYVLISRDNDTVRATKEDGSSRAPKNRVARASGEAKGEPEEALLAERATQTDSPVKPCVGYLVHLVIELLPSKYQMSRSITACLRILWWYTQSGGSKDIVVHMHDGVVGQCRRICSIFWRR